MKLNEFQKLSQQRDTIRARGVSVISNVRVMGLEGSVIASRYPKMSEAIGEDEFTGLSEGLKVMFLVGNRVGELEEGYGHRFEEEHKYLDRAAKLGRARVGTGHNNLLKGIVVQFDWKNSLSVQRQILRYNFIDIVSSSSTMHCALKMDAREQCNGYVDEEIIEIVEEKIAIYNRMKENGVGTDTLKEIELGILYSLPTGFRLTARYTTNYLQLRTMYEQRKNHKLPEWQEFCDWILTLPHFRELTSL